MKITTIAYNVDFCVIVFLKWNFAPMEISSHGERKFKKISKVQDGVEPLFSCQTFNKSTLCQWISIIVFHRWRNGTPLMNSKDLNSYHDSCMGITNVNICVVWFVHIHLFVRLDLLFISILLKLSYDFRGWRITKVFIFYSNLRVSTHF